MRAQRILLICYSNKQVWMLKLFVLRVRIIWYNLRQSQKSILGLGLRFELMIN